MQKFIFDLDNTLYPEDLNVFPLIDARINSYMRDILGIPAHEVDTLRHFYWQQYGVTLLGLITHYQTDPEDYLRYVHDVDLSQVLKPNKKLRKALEKIQCSRVIVTNGSADHAENVLSALGLEGLCEEILDVRIASFLPKPFPEPYIEMLRRMDVEARHCVMFDDLPANLKTAKDLGMKTVLVGSRDPEDYIDLYLERVCGIGDIQDFFPAQELNHDLEETN